MGEFKVQQKRDIPKLDINPTFTIPTSKPTTPEIKMEGEGNWGKIGDGFEHSVQNNGNTPPATDVPAVSTTQTKTETDTEIQEGNSALSSTDINVVRTAKSGVDSIVSSPDSSASVQALKAESDAAAQTVTEKEANTEAATEEQEAAQGTYDQASESRDAAQKNVDNQTEDLNNKEQALTTAKDNETQAKNRVSTAET